MKAVINRFDFYDYRGSDFWFDDPRDFCVIVDLLIADKEMDGGDIFDLTVCSPKWFEGNVLRPPSNHASHEPIHRSAFGRHHLFLYKFDEAEIKNAVRDIVISIRGNNWPNIALKLSRYFRWEFEDYKVTT